ncbi:GAS2-like protein 1 isoform X2 [Motacilla alba alba]|uniref:GAS2-like protein 1 isoform X2 n=1 Tax=Motacilla alba alba TaxID=1094192 RepID=UPI0018D54F84|nr:GAS2-like protein 1 isoform X2 [Motacilla alba alba]
MADPSHIQSAASKSIRPFRSSEEYLEAMKEDLAEWFNTLYDLDIQVDTFLESLETGCHLCRHANNVNRTALDFQERHPEAAARMRVPQNEVVFQAKNVVPGSFIARDNVSNFIQWCRQDLGIQDVLMFETNDLVLKKNEKNFVLCLLEVARRGSKFGMLAPMLIQMEEEIEEEMRDQMADGALGTRRESRDPQAGAFPGRARPITLGDLKNLDELVRHALPWEPCAWVREILGCCSCPSQFPMVKVSEGKYKVGDSNTLIFVRVSAAEPRHGARGRRLGHPGTLPGQARPVSLCCPLSPPAPAPHPGHVPPKSSSRHLLVPRLQPQHPPAPPAPPDRPPAPGGPPEAPQAGGFAPPRGCPLLRQPLQEPRGAAGSGDAQAARPRALPALLGRQRLLGRLGAERPPPPPGPPGPRGAPGPGLPPRLPQPRARLRAAAAHPPPARRAALVGAGGAPRGRARPRGEPRRAARPPARPRGPRGAGAEAAGPALAGARAGAAAVPAAGGGVPGQHAAAGAAGGRGERPPRAPRHRRLGILLLVILVFLPERLRQARAARRGRAAGREQRREQQRERRGERRRLPPAAVQPQPGRCEAPLHLLQLLRRELLLPGLLGQPGHAGEPRLRHRLGHRGGRADGGGGGPRAGGPRAPAAALGQAPAGHAAPQDALPDPHAPRLRGRRPPSPERHPQGLGRPAEHPLLPPGAPLGPAGARGAGRQRVALRGRWPWQLLAAPGDTPELLGRVEVAPGQATATELGWPGPLHVVTGGIRVGPARSPQPQRVPGVSPCRGEQLHGVGQSCGQGSGGRSRAGNGAGEHPVLFLVSSSLLTRPHLFSFLSSPPLLAILVILLLIFSLLSPSGLPPPSLVFSSWPSHPFPSSSSLLDLPLFSSWPHHHLLGHFLISSPLQSPLHPEMTWGHAVCHHKPCSRAGGGHCSLSSPQLATALPTARVDVPGVGQGGVPSPGHRGPHPCMSSPASKDQRS